jgi:hypothetical protein
MREIIDFPTTSHLARRLLPPVLLDVTRVLRLRVNSSAESCTDFRTFWTRFDQSSIPSKLREMVIAFVNSVDFPKVSRYWHFLNATNLELIGRAGVDNYRKNVSLNYFTWTDFSEEQAGGGCLGWPQRRRIPPTRSFSASNPGLMRCLPSSTIF